LAAPHWDSYLRLALLKSDSASVTAERDKLAAMEASLERVVSSNPKDPRARLRLAAIHLRRFEMEQRQSANSLGLSQIRDAALASRFPSQADQNAWLDRAIGENHKRLHSALQHCRYAIRHSPLQGAGYVYMADLCFLEDPREAVKQHYVEQAFQVRPNSGLVLLSIGKEAVLSGDLQTAIGHWRRAFQIDYEVRAQIVESLAELLPAEFFLTSFQPDLGGLQTLFAYYRDHQRIDEARQVGQPLVKQLVHQARTAGSPGAADLWEQARAVHHFMGNLREAVDCQRRAIDLRPGDFERRRYYATLLTQNGQHADAAETLEWCLRRHPDDLALKEELAAAKRQLTDASRAAMAPIGNSPKGSY
jgi:tetratricopeptide (TPR) repeat protein